MDEELYTRLPYRCVALVNFLDDVDLTESALPVRNAPNPAGM